MSGDYYSVKRARGELFQDFIVDLLWQTQGLAVVQYTSRDYQLRCGESRTGVEIKFDEIFCRTRNLWIEVAEKSSPDQAEWIASGIKGAHWLYVIGDFDHVFAFATTLLRHLHEHCASKYVEQMNTRETSIGYLLPWDVARQHAAFYINPQCGALVESVNGNNPAPLLQRAVRRLQPQRSLFDFNGDAPV